MTLWTFAALLLSGAMIDGLFRAADLRRFDAGLGAALERLSAAAARDTAEPKIAARMLDADPDYKRVFSGAYWRAEGPGEALARSRSLWDFALDMSPPLTGPAVVWREAPGPAGQRLRLAERRIELADGSLWRLTVARRRDGLTAEARAFRWSLIWSLTALGAAILGAAAALTAGMLKPLADLRAAMARRREGATARLVGDFPREIAPLAQDLNDMLDLHDAMTERARRQAADFAHALKTPLAVLEMELKALEEKGADPEALGHARAAAELISRQSAWRLARARVGRGARLSWPALEIAPTAEKLLSHLERAYLERGILAEMEAPPGLGLRIDPYDLDELLGNLLDNAFKWARSRLLFAAERRGDGSLALIVTDDGPGVPEERRGEILRPGARLDERVPGSGLGLAICADIMDAWGGRLEVGAAEEGGARFAAVFPPGLGG